VSRLVSFGGGLVAWQGVKYPRGLLQVRKPFSSNLLKIGLFIVRYFFALDGRPHSINTAVGVPDKAAGSPAVSPAQQIPSHIYTKSR